MKKRILLVGTSDTIYLPICARVLECMFRQKGWDVQVRSCGFFALNGQLCSPSVLRVAGEMGIDLSDHTATHITGDLMLWADLILPQNESIFRGLRQYLNKDVTKVGKPMGFEQPGSKNLEEYRELRSEVIAYCNRLVRKLMAQHREEKKVNKQAEIRTVTLQEVSQVRRLEELCFSHPWSEQGIADELANPDGYFCGAFEGDSLVGYGSLWAVLGQATINNIAVDPAYRKQGLGSRVLQAMEDYCVEHQMESITLEVRSQNLAARKLYEKHGFEQNGCRKGFYRDPPDDGVIMTKQLQ